MIWLTADIHAVAASRISRPSFGKISTHFKNSILYSVIFSHQKTLESVESFLIIFRELSLIKQQWMHYWDRSGRAGAAPGFHRGRHSESTAARRSQPGYISCLKWAFTGIPFSSINLFKSFLQTCSDDMVCQIKFSTATSTNDRIRGFRSIFVYLLNVSISILSISRPDLA